MERNWPRCLDSLISACWCSGVFNMSFIIVFGVVQFVVPFVLLWSISVILLPGTLLLAIDVPRQFPGNGDCRTWSAWWFSSKFVVGAVASILVFLLVSLWWLNRTACRLQTNVNRALHKN